MQKSMGESEHNSHSKFFHTACKQQSKKQQLPDAKVFALVYSKSTSRPWPLKTVEEPGPSIINL